MSDITQAVVQDEIASSLMDAPIVGSWADVSLAESGADVEPTQVEPGLEQVRNDGRMSQDDVDRLAQSFARPALSALQCYEVSGGDPSTLPPIAADGQTKSCIGKKDVRAPYLF